MRFWNHVAAACAAIFIGIPAAYAQGSPPDDQIYGSQLMTVQERNEYRDRMQSATSAEQRQQIQAEHQTRMQERAKEQGVTLRDQSARGAGTGAGQGGPRADLPDNQIYGSQLMTAQERNEYRDRMQSATSADERKQIQAEHHARMQDRAKERGVALPDQPPRDPGMSKGQGQGQGQGKGQGQGQGQGKGQGQGTGQRPQSGGRS